MGYYIIYASAEKKVLPIINRYKYKELSTTLTGEGETIFLLDLMFELVAGKGL